MWVKLTRGIRATVVQGYLHRGRGGEQRWEISYVQWKNDQVSHIYIYIYVIGASFLNFKKGSCKYGKGQNWNEHCGVTLGLDISVRTDRQWLNEHMYVYKCIYSLAEKTWGQ